MIVRAPPSLLLACCAIQPLCVWCRLVYWSSGVTRELVKSDLDELVAPSRLQSLQSAVDSGTRVCSQSTFGQLLSTGSAIPGQGKTWNPSDVSRIIAPGPFPTVDPSTGSADTTNNALRALWEGFCDGESAAAR